MICERKETSEARRSPGGRGPEGLEYHCSPGVPYPGIPRHCSNQVAERLNVHPNTVADYLKTGIPPAVKLSRVWKVDEEDLEEFMRARRTRKNSIRKEDQKEWNWKTFRLTELGQDPNQPRKLVDRSTLLFYVPITTLAAVLSFVQSTLRKYNQKRCF